MNLNPVLTTVQNDGATAVPVFAHNALLLCWMLVAALILCLLLGTITALQMYQAPLQQNDTNRYHIHR